MHESRTNASATSTESIWAPTTTRGPGISTAGTAGMLTASKNSDGVGLGPHEADGDDESVFSSGVSGYAPEADTCNAVQDVPCCAGCEETGTCDDCLQVSPFVTLMNAFKVQTLVCCPSNPIDMLTTLDTVFITAIYITILTLLQSLYQLKELWPQRPWRKRFESGVLNGSTKKENDSDSEEIDEIEEPVPMRCVVLLSNGLSCKASRPLAVIETEQKFKVEVDPDIEDTLWNRIKKFVCCCGLVGGQRGRELHDAEVLTVPLASAADVAYDVFNVGASDGSFLKAAPEHGLKKLVPELKRKRTPMPRHVLGSTDFDKGKCEASKEEHGPEFANSMYWWPVPTKLWPRLTRYFRMKIAGENDRQGRIFRPDVSLKGKGATFFKRSGPTNHDLSVAEKSGYEGYETLLAPMPSPFFIPRVGLDRCTLEEKGKAYVQKYVEDVVAKHVGKCNKYMEDVVAKAEMHGEAELAKTAKIEGVKMATQKIERDIAKDKTYDELMETVKEIEAKVHGRSYKAEFTITGATGKYADVVNGVYRRATLRSGWAKGTTEQIDHANEQIEDTNVESTPPRARRMSEVGSQKQVYKKLNKDGSTWSYSNSNREKKREKTPRTLHIQTAANVIDDIYGTSDDASDRIVEMDDIYGTADATAEQKFYHNPHDGSASSEEFEDDEEDGDEAKPSSGKNYICLVVRTGMGGMGGGNLEETDDAAVPRDGGM